MLLDNKGNDTLLLPVDIVGKEGAPLNNNRSFEAGKYLFDDVYIMSGATFFGCHMLLPPLIPSIAH